MKHLLVTNDFPPDVGGIQSYLWELWRRLPPESFTVLTTSRRGSEAFDRDQAFRVERIRAPVLLPHPALVRHIDRLAEQTGAELVLLDPALPLGAVGPRLSRPYGLVLHGAEITVPGRLPLSRRVLARVLRGADSLIAAGGYPAAEAERAARRALPATTRVPPGVDVDRFRPTGPAERERVRARHGVAADAPLVVSSSRLVPRKGMDVLIDAASDLRARVPGLRVLIAGTGRDAGRLQRRIERTAAPAELLGFVPDDDLPGLLGAADVYVMLCRDRWGGLEQEGFGIVFLEAAATGTPQIAGASGGAEDAVARGETGLVVDDPRDVSSAVTAIGTLLGDEPRRRAMAAASRARAETRFSYDVLARELGRALRVEPAPGG